MFSESSAFMGCCRSRLSQSDRSVAAAGLVTSLTGSQSDSVLGCVSWSNKAPSPGILGSCAAVDEKAAVLLTQRDQALLTATAALLVRITFHTQGGQQWNITDPGGSQLHLALQ